MPVPTAPPKPSPPKPGPRPGNVRQAAAPVQTNSLAVQTGVQVGAQKIGIVDCDIHPVQRSAADLYPYMSQRWREHGDSQAAHKLVTSHLRLVAKIAMGYRGYGLPVAELISEGNVGMMQAVKRFEPDKGFRLATYAMWWIKASIQEYILRSWSLVKMGTTANQKKLFFNLRKAKSQISALEEGDMRPDQVKSIATSLGVSAKSNTARF